MNYTFSIFSVLLFASIQRMLSFRPRTEYSVSLIRTNGHRKENNLAFVSSATCLYSSVKFKNFEQVLETFHQEPVAVYFSTPMCGPCKLMRKEMAAVKQSVGNELKMFSVDTEKWPEVGSRFEVTRLPCFVVFQEGEVKLRLEGVTPAASVVEEVRRIL